MRSGDSVPAPVEVDVDVNIAKRYTIHKTRNLNPKPRRQCKAPEWPHFHEKIYTTILQLYNPLSANSAKMFVS